MLKGLVAVQLSNFEHQLDNNSLTLLNLQLLLGLIAIIGHIYPIYAQFKGGKGIATLFGIIIGIKPHFALIFAILFFLIFYLTHYVALSSILSSISFTICISFFIQGKINWITITLSILCVLIVIIKHHTNITRLFKGTETKMYLFKKSKEKVDKN